MKILLINPPLLTPAVKPIYSTTITDVGNYPPLGLLYIAAYLREFTKHEPRFLDCPADGIGFEALAAEIEKTRPDVIGIYACTDYWRDVLATARLAKRSLPSAQVVVGGPHAYIYPTESASFSDVDFVVCGEGEVVFAQLLDSIAHSECLESAHVISRNSPRSVPPIPYRHSDLDALPFPALDLAPWKKYSSILAERNPIATMITSRGCPFKCAFCSNLESGNVPRLRSASNIVDEIEVRISSGIRDFLFFDEVFTLYKDRVKAICDEIVRRKLDIRWHARTRADVLDADTVDVMKKAGLRLLQFGIETGSEKIQKVLNKNLRLDKVKEIIKTVRSKGVQTYGDFLIGSPEETIEDIKKTLEFAKELRLDYAVFHITQILPGTPLLEKAIRDGLVDRDPWQTFVLDPQKGVSRSYWLGDFSEKELYSIARNCYKKFYLRPAYIADRLRKIKNIRHFIWHTSTAFNTFVATPLRRFVARIIKWKN